MKKYQEIYIFPSDKVLNFQKTTYFFNETGLYELLTKSNKYILKEEDKENFDKINKKLNNYKKELEYYSNKYNFEPSENGYFYIKKKMENIYFIIANIKII
jgi:hypothetical protein